MLFRPPERAREGGPTPEASASASSARSPAVSEKHLVHFYDDDAQLLDVVGTFLARALVRGDGVLVIATEEHRARFEALLQSAGVDVARAAGYGRYVALDAAGTLHEIMDGDLPSAERFERVVRGEVVRLAERFARVRAFGEMVGLLCTAGKIEAAFRLEAFWNELLADMPTELLCAYPASWLRSAEGSTALEHICAAHSGVVGAEQFTTRTPPRND